jgi:hypothetical protein
MDIYCDTCTRVLNNALRDNEQAGGATAACYHRDGRLFAVLFDVAADSATRSEITSRRLRPGRHLGVGTFRLDLPVEPAPPMPDPDWLAGLAGVAS